VVRRFLAVSIVVVVLAWPSAALAQAAGPTHPRQQVVLTGDVSVPRGTVVGEVVVFSGSATVAGVVDGDVVVIDGPITVSGQVGGDVIALHGPVRLLGTAQVGGDVRAGKSLDIAQGAHVAGAIRHDVGFTLSGPVGVLGALLASVAMAVSILLTGLLMLLLAPRGAERTAEAVRTAPFASAGWGLLLAFALPILGLALAVTILGLPLGLVLLLGLGLIWLAGLTFATFAIGRLLVREPRSRVGAFFTGWAIVAAIGLVPFLNAAVWTLAGAFGVGTMLVAGWRARSGPASAPTPRGGRHRAVRGTPDPPVPIEVPEVVAVEDRPSDASIAED
jgi:cytoskeletal protein CcmA (bactofilin family)